MNTLMGEFRENRARPRIGRAVRSAAAALQCPAALCHSDLAHAVPHGGGGGRVSTAGADLVGFTGADFTPAHLMAAGSTVVSRTCTMVSAAGMGLTRTMAGATDGRADGGVNGWGGLIIRILMVGTTIRIRAIMTRASLTPPKPGTIVPIL